MNKQRCWYPEIVDIARKNEIELNIDDIQNMTMNQNALTSNNIYTWLISIY